MTLRDVHNRCVTCGRPPGEACCDTCHRVAWALEKQIHDNRKALARGADVNTEAVNQ